MTFRNFEVHYCPSQQVNICVEAFRNEKGYFLHRCLYETPHCPSCPYLEKNLRKLRTEKKK